jgi:hypothetical protein
VREAVWWVRVLIPKKAMDEVEKLSSQEESSILPHVASRAGCLMLVALSHFFEALSVTNAIHLVTIRVI